MFGTSLTINEGLIQDYLKNSVVFENEADDLMIYYLNKQTSQLSIRFTQEMFEENYINLTTQKNNNPYYFFDNHNDSETVKFIKNKKTDLIVNLGSPRILKSKIKKLLSP